MNITRFQKMFAFIFVPVSCVYGALMAMRRRLWESGCFRQLTPSCPCVSVGNIAWGGTGKTPVVGWIMDWALERNIKPVVLMRGYKADTTILPVHVNPHHSAREVGDEPLMLSLQHPGSSVLVDPQRCRSGAYAMKSLEPGIMVLDDGFQHLAVNRHLNIVVLRPEDVQDQWNKVIPAGSWREGAAALKRADVFLIKADREKMIELAPFLHEKLRYLRRPVFSFTLQPSVLAKVGSTSGSHVQDFGKRPYLLVSGVGNPQQVCDTATRFFGQPPEMHEIFPDHHTYIFKEASRLAAMGMPVVCTAKDAVKLRHMPLPELWCLRVQVAFGPMMWTRKSFGTWWQDWWDSQRVDETLLDLFDSCERPTAEACGFDEGVELAEMAEVVETCAPAAEEGAETSVDINLDGESCIELGSEESVSGATAPEACGLDSQGNPTNTGVVAYEIDTAPTTQDIASGMLEQGTTREPLNVSPPIDLGEPVTGGEPVTVVSMKKASGEKASASPAELGPSFKAMGGADMAKMLLEQRLAAAATPSGIPAATPFVTTAKPPEKNS